MAIEKRAPLCPACGKRMKLVRVTERAYGRYRLRTLACDGCEVSYTEGVPDDPRKDENHPLPPAGKGRTI